MATSIVWRRFDLPGHDACRLLRRPPGWRLEGFAVFRGGRLAYRLELDAAWRSRRGRVSGRLGTRKVDLRIARSARGRWSLNGRPIPELDGCEDLDFGFTPASNLASLRRLKLRVGQRAEFSVAWLDVGRRAMKALPQRYERRSESIYAYASPAHRYRATLEVDPSGFVLRYGRLWRAARGK
jgi:hypothetical protein